MTLILDLPEELAARLASLLPEEDRDRFAVAAIAEALATRQREDESRLAEALVADLYPDAEPEREAAECRAAIEEALVDVEAGRNTMTLDEARRRWAGAAARCRFRLSLLLAFLEQVEILGRNDAGQGLAVVGDLHPFSVARRALHHL